MNLLEKDGVRQAVRQLYSRAAESGCCGPNCCSGPAPDLSPQMGYSPEEMQAVPDGANLGLGCGNPVAIASLKEGDIVLDLGSGSGFDAFLAAKKVGKTGKVIGVDMTPEMLERARKNAVKGNYTNVEFRQGEIEKLPVDDNYIDVIISNCVINLSPDKEAVFREAFRVLKSGGRLMVSDLVLIKDLPEKIKESVEAYVGCIAGAIKKDAYLSFISKAGFKDVKVISQSGYPIDAMFENLESAEEAIASIKVSAVKKGA